MRATAEEIAAMRARLAEKQEKRRLDLDIAQAIAIVQHRPFVQPVQTPVEPAAKRKTGHVSVTECALGHVSVAKYALGHFVRRILKDWLFWLGLAMTIWIISNLF